MGRTALFMSLLAAGAAFALAMGCSGSGGVDGAAAMAHARHLVGLGPRPAGSEALARAADYIAGELEQLGLEPRRQEWLDEKEKITLRNVWAQIDGEDPEKGPILVLGAHYDTKLADGKAGRKDIRFVGAIDGAGAPAVLLELARALTRAAEGPRINVWVLFLDGEESIPWEWDEDRSLLGSRHFVRAMSQDEELFPGGIKSRMKAFVLLDLIGAADIKIDRDTNSHKGLQDLFREAAREMGESDRVYRYESGWTDDHMSFTAYGIPSVLLIDFAGRVPGQDLRGESYAQWWHTEQDDLDAMSPEALAFAGNLVLKAFPALERWVQQQ